MPPKNKQLPEIKIPKAVYQQPGKVTYDVTPLQKNMLFSLRITVINGKPEKLSLRADGKARRSIQENELKLLAGLGRSKWTRTGPIPPPSALIPPKRDRYTTNPDDICNQTVVSDHVHNHDDGKYYICWYYVVTYCDGRVKYFDLFCIRMTHNKWGEPLPS